MPKKERAERIKTFSLKHVSFICNFPHIDEPFSISNLSYSGLGLSSKKILPSIASDKRISGLLCINDDQFELNLEVIRIQESFWGCRFTQEMVLLSRYLKKEFDIELAALKMTSIDPTILSEQEDGTPHWYFDGGVCEIYFVTDKENVARYRMKYFGHTIEAEGSHRPNYNGSSVATIPKQVFDGFLRFLNNIEALEENYREQMEASIARILDKKE